MREPTLSFLHSVFLDHCGARLAGEEAAVGSGDGLLARDLLAFGVLVDGAAAGLVFLVVDLVVVLFKGVGFAAGGAFFWLATDFEKKEKRLPCFNDLAFFAGGAMVKSTQLRL